MPEVTVLVFGLVFVFVIAFLLVRSCPHLEERGKGAI